MTKASLAGFQKALLSAIQPVRQIGVLEQAATVCQEDKALSYWDEKSWGGRVFSSFLLLAKAKKKKKPNLVLLCLKKITRQYTIFILVSEQIGHLKTSAILYPCLSNRKDINKARFMAFASTATWETHTWEYLHTRSFYSIHCTMQMSGRRTWFLLEKDHAFASEYTFNLLQMDRNRVLIPSLTWAYCHAGSSFQWCTEIALLPLVSSLFGEGPGRLSLLSDSSWLAPSGLSSRLPDLPHFWHCSSWFRSTWTTNK